MKSFLFLAHTFFLTTLLTSSSAEGVRTRSHNEPGAHLFHMRQALFGNCQDPLKKVWQNETLEQMRENKIWSELCKDKTWSELLKDGKTLGELFEDKNFTVFWSKVWRAIKKEKEFRVQLELSFKNFFPRHSICKRLCGFLKKQSSEDLKLCFSSLASFYQENKKDPEMTKFIRGLGARRLIDLSDILEPEDEKETNFRQVLTHIHALSTQEDMPLQLKEWLSVALQGGAVTLVSAVCPDYATEEDTNGNRRYTFQGVDSGIGLVTRRFLDTLPELVRFFHDYKMKVKIRIALGDFEAFSAAILEKVQLTEEGFLERLRGSQKAIQEEVQRIIQEKSPQGTVTSEVGLFTDFYGGRECFEKACQRFKELFDKGQYGDSGLDEEKVKKILDARKPLYERWYGEKEDYFSRLKKQAAEYAAMGELIKNNEENHLIVQADHDAMRLWWDVSGPLNLCYLKPKTNSSY